MNEQKARVREFMHRLGYNQVIDGEKNIKGLLNIKNIGAGEQMNCADLIGFRPNMAYAQSAVFASPRVQALIGRCDRDLGHCGIRPRGHTGGS